MATPTTTIRLPADLREQIHQYAKTENTTNTEVITQALQAFFANEQSSSRKARIQKELMRLAEIDRADPELEGFFDEPESNYFEKRL